MTLGAFDTLPAPDGVAAPPRQNGELVFKAPWESRAFGIGIALHDAGAIDFKSFRSLLIAEIEGRAGGAEADDGERYYERWLDALQRLLVEEAILSDVEISERSHEIAHAWAHDHGHQHPHDDADGGGHP